MNAAYPEHQLDTRPTRRRRLVGLAVVLAVALNLVIYLVGRACGGGFEFTKASSAPRSMR